MTCTTLADAGRRGVTLVELLVVLVILGVLAGVVGLAFQPAAAANDDPAATTRNSIAAARRHAISTGESVSITIALGEDLITVLALPDGRVLGAERLGLDQLSGSAHGVR